MTSKKKGKKGQEPMANKRKFFWKIKKENSFLAEARKVKKFLRMLTRMRKQKGEKKKVAMPNKEGLGMGNKHPS